jgi:hypothetical protein
VWEWGQTIIRRFPFAGALVYITPPPGIAPSIPNLQQPPTPNLVRVLDAGIVDVAHAPQALASIALLGSDTLGVGSYGVAAFRYFPAASARVGIGDVGQVFHFIGVLGEEYLRTLDSGQLAPRIRSLPPAQSTLDVPGIADACFLHVGEPFVDSESASLLDLGRLSILAPTTQPRAPGRTFVPPYAEDRPIQLSDEATFDVFASGPGCDGIFGIMDWCYLVVTYPIPTGIQASLVSLGDQAMVLVVYGRFFLVDGIAASDRGIIPPQAHATDQIPQSVGAIDKAYVRVVPPIVCYDFLGVMDTPLTRQSLQNIYGNVLIPTDSVSQSLPIPQVTLSDTLTPTDSVSQSLPSPTSTVQETAAVTDTASAQA